MSASTPTTPLPSKIAIVDDDDGARDALQFLVNVLGQDADGFASAADLLRDGCDRYACLILDQNMPTMTGLELVQHLRSNDNPIPVMLISGDLTPEVIDKAKCLGVDIVEDKPPPLSILSAFIKESQI